MTYTSLKSPENRDYTYILNVAHLYGNLLNTYGDNGNILMMKYVGEKLGAKMTFDIVSVGDDFDKELYDIVFFGGGQDYEQSIVAKDLPSKRDAIDQYIQDNKVILAICGGFQLLGQYYIQANGVRIDGIGVMGHYTLNQENNRYIGDIKIHNEEFNETYYGFENHQGRTFLAEDSRNANLAYRLVTTALRNKYGQDIQLPSYDDILSSEIAEEYADTKSKAEFEK